MQLWHEIHYQRVMEKQQTDSLTPLQKFRCRKRYCTVRKPRFLCVCVLFSNAEAGFTPQDAASWSLLFLGILTTCGNVRKFP